MSDSKRLLNPIKSMKNHLKGGSYQFTDHALEQINSRDVIISEVLEALETGEHRPNRDKWREDLGR